MSSTSAPQYSAVVTGGTGAIGRELVAELLASPDWKSVTVVGRTKWTVPANWTAKIDAEKEEKAGRLINKVVDLEGLSGPSVNAPNAGPATNEGLDAFKGADAGFCCLGTTHGDAGSPAAFRRVDLDYVAAVAKASKASGTGYFAHVTASGTGGFMSGLTNYGRTKAAAEEAIKGLGFKEAVIYRPGLLDREDKLRNTEKWLVKVLPSVKVGAVARMMRLDAEKALKGGLGKAFRVVEDSEIPR